MPIVLISEALLLRATATDGRILRDRVLCGFGVRLNARKRTFLIATSVSGKQFRMSERQLVMVTDNDAGVANRICGGEDCDLAILPPEVLEALDKEGAIYAGSIVSVAKVVTGKQNDTVYAGALAVDFGATSHVKPEPPVGWGHEKIQKRRARHIKQKRLL